MSPLQQAERALAEGDLDRVRELWAQALALQGDEKLRWFLVLAAGGELDAARSLLPELAPEEHDRALPLLEAACEAASEEPSGDDLFEPDLPARERPADEEVVALFLRWFGGRRDLYARQWWDERRRRGGYRPVEEPLTARVARAHFEGRITVGQYLLFPDATCAFGVIDLDVSGGALSALRASRGEAASALDHGELRSYALRLLDGARRLGLELFAEDSGGKGLHLWVFFEPRRPARAVRSVLSQVLASAGPQPAEVGVEIYPKQEHLGPRGLSSLVKLPLGVHQATLRRCPLLDEALRPIDDAGAALRRLRAADPATVEAMLARRLVALPAPDLGPLEPAPPLPEVGSPRSMAEALRAIPAGAEEWAACDRMIRGCAPLAEIVRRAFEQRRLAADEARAVTYTLGLVGESGELAQEILAAAGASTKELMRVRRGLPSPVGCAKLRRMVPERSGACPCSTAGRAAPYPTPAVFAVGERAPAPPGWKPFAPWLDKDASVVQGPFDALGEKLDRIEQRLARLEEEARMKAPLVRGGECSEPADESDSGGRGERRRTAARSEETASEGSG